MNDDNYLLLAMEALVKPIRSKVLQDGPVGSGLAGQRTVTVTLPSLLDQLGGAANGVGIGGSSSLPWTRSMIDAEAVEMLTKIGSTLNLWLRIVKTKPLSTDPTSKLRTWYVAYQESDHSEHRDKMHTHNMNRWAAQIRAKFAPVKVWEIAGRCPVCRQDTWWSKQTHEEYKFPLVTEYSETGPDLIQTARALCRACEHVWSVRELAYLLECDTPEIEDVAI